MFGEQVDSRTCRITSGNFLLQLDRPFNASDAIRAVEYLRAGGTNPGTHTAVDTAGWGSSDNLGSRPDKLREVFVEVVSSRRCARSDYFGKKFTSNMICAHKICADPCDLPFNTLDSCDVSFCSLAGNGENLCVYL